MKYIISFLKWLLSLLEPKPASKPTPTPTPMPTPSPQVPSDNSQIFYLEYELYVNPHSAVAQFLASHPNDLDGIFTLVGTGHLTCGQSEHINPHILFYLKRHRSRAQPHSKNKALGFSHTFRTQNGNGQLGAARNHLI